MSVKNRFLTLFAYVVGALLVWAMVGCGGAGGSSSGSVAMKIAWPAPTRYLPTYARSIVFSLYNADALYNPEGNSWTVIANRPDTLPLVQTVQFNGPIPAGTYTVTGEAKTGANGLGNTVAAARNTVQVKASGTTTVAMTLGTTLSSLSLRGMPLDINVGQSKLLTVVVKDQQGNQILLPDGALTWSLLFGGDSVTLGPTGFLTANGAGSARVRVSEVGANLYSEGDINVFPLYTEGGLAGLDRMTGIKVKLAKHAATRRHK